MNPVLLLDSQEVAGLNRKQAQAYFQARADQLKVAILRLPVAERLRLAADLLEADLNQMAVAVLEQVIGEHQKTDKA